MLPMHLVHSTMVSALYVNDHTLSLRLSSPVAALASASTFLILRTAVLRHANSYNLSFWVLPVAVLITIFINVFFVFTKVCCLTLQSVLVELYIAKGMCGRHRGGNPFALCLQRQPTKYPQHLARLT